jgi:hypothetical protein
MRSSASLRFSLFCVRGIRADVEFRIDRRENAAGNAHSLGYPIPPILTIRFNR